MAAVTLLGTATFSTANGSKTVTATPAVDDLIVIITAHSGNTSTSATPPTDDQSGTYTLVNSALKNSSADVLCAWVRTAKIASAVSTIFTHSPGTTSGGGLAVLKVTGMSRVGSQAIKQSGVQQNQASGTPTVTLGQAVLTANAVVGAVFNGANPATLTPRSSPAYTERVDTGYNTPTSGLEVMSINSGETASSIAWGSSSATAFGAVAVELDTATTTSHSTSGTLTAGTGTISGTAVRNGTTKASICDSTEKVNASGTTINGINFGAEAVDRIIFLSFWTNAEPSAASIGGVSATIDKFLLNTNDWYCIAVAHVPTGTSGSLTMTSAGTSTAFRGAFRITGSAMPVFGATHGVSTAVSLNTTLGGVACGITLSDGGTTTWNGETPTTYTTANALSASLDVNVATTTQTPFAFGSSTVTAVVSAAAFKPTHGTTGTLSGGAGAVAGTASSATTRSSTGTLSAGTGAVAGTAARESSSVTHATSGTLSAGTGDITGYAVEAYPPPSATLGGTVTASITESDVVAGGKTITLTLAGDSWLLADPDAFPERVIDDGELYTNSKVNDPCVIAEANGYTMWLSGDTGFSGDIKIYRARSRDRRNWTLSPSTAVLQHGGVGSTDEQATETPTVVVYGGMYHMFYTGYPPPGSDSKTFRILHATSPDGVTWTKDGSFIIAPTDPDNTTPNMDFNQWVTSDPGAIVYNGELYLYFTAIGANATTGTDLQTIGLTKYNGTSWSTPAMVLMPDQGLYPRATYYGLSTPSAVIHDSKVTLFFSVVQASDYKQVRIGNASSANGETGWTFHNYPVIDRTASTWASNEVIGATAQSQNGHLHVWFAGNDGSLLGIGYKRLV